MNMNSLRKLTGLIAYLCLDITSHAANGFTSQAQTPSRRVPAVYPSRVRCSSSVPSRTQEEANDLWQLGQVSGEMMCRTTAIAISIAAAAAIADDDRHQRPRHR